MHAKIRYLLGSLVLVSCTAQAQPISHMTISDVDGDGLAGCFRFISLDPATCSGANLFSSDDSGSPGTVGTGSERIPGVGADDLDNNGLPDGIVFGRFQPITDFADPASIPVNTTAQVPIGPISPGFLFASFPFVPTTFNPATQPGIVNGEVATVPAGSVVGSGDSALLQIDSLPFGALYNSNMPNFFFLDPDFGTLVTQITADHGDGTFDYLMSWSHLITDDENPTGQMVNLTTFWRLEGVVTVVPVPPAVWLLGSGLVGLVGVARRKRGLHAV